MRLPQRRRLPRADRGDAGEAEREPAALDSGPIPPLDFFPRFPLSDSAQARAAAGKGAPEDRRLSPSAAPRPFHALARQAEKDGADAARERPHLAGGAAGANSWHGFSTRAPAYARLENPCHDQDDRLLPR